MALRRSAFTRNLGPLALLVLALGLSACGGAVPRTPFAPPVSPETTIEVNSNLREAVAIGITNSPVMTDSLTVSLAVRDMLAKSNETFRLEVGLVSQPPLTATRGGGFESVSKYRYRLMRVTDNTVVFDREITATYTAKFGDAVIGVERMVLALRGSAQQSIDQFLTALIAEERANPQAFSRTSRPRRS
jgi:hypothetical protein